MGKGFQDFDVLSYIGKLNGPNGTWGVEDEQGGGPFIKKSLKSPFGQRESGGRATATPCHQGKRGGVSTSHLGFGGKPPEGPETKKGM